MTQGGNMNNKKVTIFSLLIIVVLLSYLLFNQNNKFTALSTDLDEVEYAKNILLEKTFDLEKLISEDKENGKTYVLTIEKKVHEVQKLNQELNNLKLGSESNDNFTQIEMTYNDFNLYTDKLILSMHLNYADLINMFGEPNKVSIETLTEMSTLYSRFVKLERLDYDLFTAYFPINDGNENRRIAQIVAKDLSINTLRDVHVGMTKAELLNKYDMLTKDYLTNNYYTTNREDSVPIQFNIENNTITEIVLQNFHD